MKEWTQFELESIFVRKDVYAENRDDFERRMSKIESLLEWFQRLIIMQGAVLIVAIILFVVERASGV